MKPTSCLLCMGNPPGALHTICVPGDMSKEIDLPVCRECHEDMLQANWFEILTRMLRVDAGRSTWKGRDQTDAVIADKYRLCLDVKGRYLEKWKLVEA